MVPEVLPELFRANGSPALKVIELAAGFAAEMASKAIGPAFACRRIKSPAARAVFPVLMLMQDASKVTVVVVPAVTIFPLGVFVAPAHPAPPPGVFTGNSLSQCWLASISVLSA